MVYVCTWRPSKGDCGVDEIPAFPVEAKELYALYSELNMVITRLIIEFCLEMGLIYITREVSDRVELDWGASHPKVEETLVMTHTWLCRLNCDWHHKVRGCATVFLAPNRHGSIFYSF